MSEREPPAREPERLLHDRQVGKLISQANGLYRARLDESGAFQRLSERMERPRRSWHWQGLTLGAVLSAAAGVVMVLGVFDDASFGHAVFTRALFREALLDDGRSRVALGPELSAGRRVPRDGRESPGQRQSPAQELGAEALAAPVDAQRASSEDAVGSVSSQRATADAKPALREADGARPAVSPSRERQVARGEASARSEPSLPNDVTETQVVGAPQLAARPGPERADGASKGELEGITRADAEHARGAGRGAAPTMASGVVGASGVMAASRVEAPSSAARAVEARLDCSDLLQKDARAAEHCYAQRAAESSGLSAEAALYELARLRRDVQDDAKGALAALNEYRDRFPRGSLRNEVGLSRVELLSELGRGREALNEAEALLGSAKGGERAAELHLLRGNIFRRDLADFAQAAREYSKAEKFGGSFGAEATRLRGLSLEALGDVEGALAAYRRYLSGPEQPRKGEVHRRVEALMSSQRGATP
jgi:hypothetical protein